MAQWNYNHSPYNCFSSNYPHFIPSGSVTYSSSINSNYVEVHQSGENITFPFYGTGKFFGPSQMATSDELNSNLNKLPELSIAQKNWLNLIDQRRKDQEFLDQFSKTRIFEPQQISVIKVILFYQNNLKDSQFLILITDL